MYGFVKPLNFKKHLSGLSPKLQKDWNELYRHKYELTYLVEEDAKRSASLFPKEYGIKHTRVVKL